jgi:hypothetical protein
MSEGEKKDNITAIIEYFEEIKKFSDSGIAMLSAPKPAELDADELFDYTVKIQDAIEEIRDLIFNVSE